MSLIDPRQTRTGRSPVLAQTAQSVPESNFIQMRQSTARTAIRHERDDREEPFAAVDRDRNGYN